MNEPDDLGQQLSAFGRRRTAKRRGRSLCAPGGAIRVQVAVHVSDRAASRQPSTCRSDQGPRPGPVQGQSMSRSEDPNRGMGCHPARPRADRRTPDALDPTLRAHQHEHARHRDECHPDRAGTRSRAPLALHPAEGTITVRIKNNGQVKALSCLFYVSTSRAGQQVHVLWNEQSVEIFTHDGEHLIDYPRPSTTGLYYGPRTPRQGTPMKTAGQNPSAGITGTAQRSVSKGGYVGALASKL